jgi:hypothetical protein
MSEQAPEQTMTEGQEQKQNDNNKNTERSTFNNTTRYRSNNRNNNLATLASAARNFKGKIEDLSVIGKQYENTGVAWEVLQKEVAEYSVLNLDYGDDLSYLLENMDDDAVKAYGNAPIWDNTKKDDYGAQQIYSKKLDLHLKREAAYDRNKKKVYTILYGQCTPSLLSGIKFSNEFNIKDKDKDPVWIMKLIKRLSVGIDESENELCTIFQLNKRFYSIY